MKIDDIDVPAIYKNLLSRVEELEHILSKTALKSPSKTKFEHADIDKAEEIDGEELETEKISPVKLASKAYLKIAMHAKKYANSSLPVNDWVEVIGLLTGKIVNENTPVEQVQISDGWPVGHGDAVSVQILDTQSIHQIMNQLPKGNFIVGWYHSHPSYGNFLSIDDYNTQSRYQALWSKAIALVIDPTEISSSNYGFGIFRNTKKEPGSKGYTELSTEVEGLAPSAAYEILKLIRPAFEGNDLRFLGYEK